MKKRKYHATVEVRFNISAVSEMDASIAIAKYVYCANAKGIEAKGHDVVCITDIESEAKGTT